MPTREEQLAKIEAKAKALKERMTLSADPDFRFLRSTRRRLDKMAQEASGDAASVLSAASAAVGQAEVYQAAVLREAVR